MDMATAVLVVTIRAITETGITGIRSRGQKRKKKQGLSVDKNAWRLETQRVGGWPITSMSRISKAKAHRNRLSLTIIKGFWVCREK